MSLSFQCYDIMVIFDVSGQLKRSKVFVIPLFFYEFS